MMAICSYTDDGIIEYDDELCNITPVLYNALPIIKEKEYVIIAKPGTDGLILCSEK